MVIKEELHLMFNIFLVVGEAVCVGYYTHGSFAFSFVVVALDHHQRSVICIQGICILWIYALVSFSGALCVVRLAAV